MPGELRSPDAEASRMARAESAYKPTSPGERVKHTAPPARGMGFAGRDGFAVSAPARFFGGRGARGHASGSICEICRNRPVAVTRLLPAQLARPLRGGLDR